MAQACRSVSWQQTRLADRSETQEGSRFNMHPSWFQSGLSETRKPSFLQVVSGIVLINQWLSQRGWQIDPYCQCGRPDAVEHIIAGSSVVGLRPGPAPERGLPLPALRRTYPFQASSAGPCGLYSMGHPSGPGGFLVAQGETVYLNGSARRSCWHILMTAAASLVLVQ